MKFRVTPRLNDGLNEAPPIEIQAEYLGELLGEVATEMCNDYGEPFGKGFSLLIERTE